MRTTFKIVKAFSTGKHENMIPCKDVEKNNLFLKKNIYFRIKKSKRVLIVLNSFHIFYGQQKSRFIM